MTPLVVTNALGGLPAHSTTYLLVCLLAAISGIKLLDLVIRVRQQGAWLAERGLLGGLG